MVAREIEASTSSLCIGLAHSAIPICKYLGRRLWRALLAGSDQAISITATAMATSATKITISTLGAGEK